MRDIRLDFRYAIRALRSSSASTLTAIATLALGIGMTTSIFSVVNGIVLRPLPFPNEDRIVNVCEVSDKPDTWCGISPPNAEDLFARSRAFQAFGIGREWGPHLQTVDGSESIAGGIATPGFFRALGARVVRGRMLVDADITGRESDVTLISYESWRARFGKDPNIIGRVIVLDGRPVTIAGVLDSGFAPPRTGDPKEVWRPLPFDPRDEKNREWSGFVGFGLLRPGVSIDAARHELAGIATQLSAEHFTTINGWSMTMVATRDLVVGAVRPMLYLFLAAVLVVLLIGCANVANLLLARATTRGREMALRAALGASPGRIVRALMVESLVLGLLGGAIGVLIALGTTTVFKVVAPARLPRVAQVSIDARVLIFALGLALATTVLFGLVPALRGARVDLAQSLREGGRGLARHRGRFGSILVSVELALAVVLVASAGLLSRSFVALTSWKPGFEQEHLVTFTAFAATEKYKGDALANLWRRAETEIRAIPGVTSVATASAGPLFGGDGSSEMAVTQRGTRVRLPVWWYDASPDYFATFGVPIVRGRALDDRLDATNGPWSGVVNETLARKFWPGEDPIGKTIVWPVGTDSATIVVVGVARDIPSMRPGEAVNPQLWWSNRQAARPFTYFIVRTATPPSSVAGAIRARMRAIDRDLEPKRFTTLPEYRNDELKTPRFAMLLIATFGFAALFFAAIGTYGLLSYVVSQRTREIGIRLALGADRGRILASVVRGGLLLAVPGIIVGIALTLIAGRFMRSLVVGVSPTDPLTLGGAGVVLLTVAAAACFIPGWRASRVDPMVTLGSE